MWRTSTAWIAALVTMVGATTARAQSFPAQIWEPLPCGLQVMTDAFRDQSGAVNERDIVGDLGAPAGYSAGDAQFLYLGLRLDQDPAPDGKLRPFAWGVGISVDGDAATYEILLMVNGSTKAVEIYRNSSTTQINDPRDPADTPAVASYPFTTHGRASVAPDSGYGGDADYFLDLAVPWSALKPLGLSPTTPATVWVGSSSTANALNGDLACHDGSVGAPTLSGAATGRTVLDPTLDTDSDGYPDWFEVRAGTDPTDASSMPASPFPTRTGVDLEGGGGCSLGPRPAHPNLVLLLLVGLLGRRRC